MSDIQKRAERVRSGPRSKVEIKADREELALTESWYSAGESGPCAHVHRRHSDCFYVLNGELVFELGPKRECVTVAAGGFVLVPPGVAHTFRNEGPAACRFLNMHAPACRFADQLRGKDVDFDTHEPPQDGGAPASQAAVVPGNASTEGLTS